MKKFLVTILAIVYLGVSSGVAMTIHYCMGKVSSVELLTHNDKCSKCGMKAGTGCCKDDFKIFKLNDAHKLISNDINIFTPVAIIDNSKSIFDSNVFLTQITSDFNNHSPPVSQGISLNVLYSVFRI
ncbi:MAG TPA: hypothetical protein VGP43_01560 [Chitinophagaceae bacterium]|nr:hypothetical protein [Chitinophagaceae bacterium]